MRDTVKLRGLLEIGMVLSERPGHSEFKRKGGTVKIEIDGNKIKISGNRGVSLIIYAFEQKNNETFMLSLSYRGFERGILPMIDIYDENTIKVTNNMKTGTYLLDGGEHEKEEEKENVPMEK